jgi:uncharacterized protein involved in exopolysaccharide biosynthesis
VDYEEVEGKGVLLALRRKWKWLVAGVIIGALVAMLLVVVLPKKYTASADVQVSRPNLASADRQAQMQTDAALARSIPVAEGALKALNDDGDPEDLQKEYTVTPVTDELVRFQATASTAEEAAARVGAIANSFLDYLAADENQQLDSVKQTVQARTDSLNTRIAELERQIAGLSSASDQLSPQQSLQLTALVGQRTEMTNELSAVQDTLAQAESENRLMLNKSKVLAAPLLPKEPTSPRPREFGVIGVVLGGLIAAGVIIGADVLGRRLFKREELARAAGVSVVASLKMKGKRHRLTSTGRARRLAKQILSPSKDLKRAARSLAFVLRSRSSGSPPPVMIVSMEADDAAVALTLRLAMDLAGRRWGEVHRPEAATRHVDTPGGPNKQRRRWRDIIIVDCTAVEHPMVGPVLRAALPVSGQPDQEEMGSARCFRVKRTPDDTVSWDFLFRQRSPLAVFGAVTERLAGRQRESARPDAIERTDLVIAFIGDWRSAMVASDQLPIVDEGMSFIVVRSGKVTAANVQECAAALTQAGAPPAGVIVMNPDRFDTSTGQLPPPATPASTNGSGPPALAAHVADEPEVRALRRL